MFLRSCVFAFLATCAVDVVARERAVLIYPREVALFGRIFYSAHQNLLLRTLRGTYKVDVHEQIATDDDLFAIDVRGAKLLVLSGHGDAFSMHLARRNERTLDATDRERLGAFLDALDPEATIVLQSCYTGRGFAHMVKELAGPARRVIAAKGEIPRDGVAITSTQPFDATISCRDDDGTFWDCTIRL